MVTRRLDSVQRRIEDGERLDVDHSVGGIAIHP